VEHELGWRAQFAYPKTLFLSLDALPFTLAEIRSRLEMLTTYRIDIFVADPKGNIPLWAKESGCSPVGLDYLIERSKQDHDRRQQERTLKKGDRVAILGRGIAVVEQVDSKWIQAAVLGKIALRIARKEIVWDDGNMRWETKVLAPNGV
jgi:preprotein translocase subunit YajC